jgi:hypothetical protein
MVKSGRWGDNPNREEIFPYYFAGWGNIVAFTRVLTMYQIYHTWIHPFHCSPLSPSPYTRNNFNRCHFCIYLHVFTVFAPCSPSYPLSLPPPPFHWYHVPSPPAHVLFCPSVLHFCRRIKKKMTFLLETFLVLLNYIFTTSWLVVKPQLSTNNSETGKASTELSRVWA